MEHCIEINRLENEADKLVRKAVADLFINEKDPITIIKLKEVYDFLEATTDYCEDVADTLSDSSSQKQLGLWIPPLPW